MQLVTLVLLLHQKDTVHSKTGTKQMKVQVIVK